MSEIHTEKYLRTRRFRLCLPVLIIPIVTVFFWLMGGGVGSASVMNKKSGLNMQLPGAQVVKDSAKDKLAFYASADADSSKRLEQLRMDPYRKDTGSFKVQHRFSPYANEKTVNKVPVTHETDLSERIAAIQRQAAVQREPEQQKPITVTSPDPEMEAINSTLDKLMAIQNPKKTVDVNSSVTPSFAVNAGEENDTTFFGRKKAPKNQSSFYNDAGRKAGDAGAINAMIAAQQTIQSGSVVKLELRVPVVVSGMAIPVGTNVFGIASLEGERLLIHIPSIRFGNTILPVSLNVYDMDGLEGIYVPGSVSRDVAKETTDNAVQSLGIAGFDFKTQAANAGIGAAKRLLSKKVKQVRVSVAAGYQVLLHDNKQNGQ